MNKSKLRAITGIVICAFAVAGCSAGNAVAGTDEAATKQEFAKQDPQKQIQGIQHSPMPPADKEKKIQEIEAKYGIKRNAADPVNLRGKSGP